MDFDFTDEQRMLQDSVQRLMQDRYTFELRSSYLREASGYSSEIWSQFAELGLLALPFSEEDGGMDGGPVEAMIVMQALGGALALEPYLSTVVVSGAVLRAVASPQMRAQWVEQIASGKLTVALAHTEAQSRYCLSDVATVAVRNDCVWTLNGHKVAVMGGDSAGRLIVSARTSGQGADEHGITLFAVDANAVGVSRRGFRTQDHSRAAEIRLSDVKVADDQVIGSVDRGYAAIETAAAQGIAALCAEGVGVMQRLHQMTVDYLKVRKQFGVTIGSFQALQHRAVDMLVAIEQATSMCYFATMMAAHPDSAERAKAVSAAKIQLGKSARFVGQEAIQLHGGIGMTEECYAGHYMRRLTMMEIQFGDTSHHLQQLARSGGLL